MLLNRAIGHVKVQWEHYGLEEATWELEDAMRLAHPFLFESAEHRGRCQCSVLFIFLSTEDNAIEGGGECNTPVLNPLH